jgi:hypothetical protein
MVKHTAEQCKEDSMEKGEKMRRDMIVLESQEDLFGVSTRK